VVPGGGAGWEYTPPGPLGTARSVGGGATIPPWVHQPADRPEPGHRTARCLRTACPLVTRRSQNCTLGSTLLSVSVTSTFRVKRCRTGVQERTDVRSVKTMQKGVAGMRSMCTTVSRTVPQSVATFRRSTLPGPQFG